VLSPCLAGALKPVVAVVVVVVVVVVAAAVDAAQ